MRLKPPINHLSLIRWLMILSQAVLLLFAARWLQSEYGREKARINKELAGCFQEAEEEVTDSVLKVVVIDPLIRQQKDSLTRMEIRFDGTPPADWCQKIEIDTGANGRKIGVMAITTTHDRTWLDSAKGIRKLAVKKSDQAMLRGVKLLIRGMEDSLLIGEGSTYVMGNQWMDTEVIRERFLRKTEALYPQARFSWDTLRLGAGSFTGSQQPFEYLMIHNDQVLSVRLESPFRLVIRSMTSAILFSLVVVLLTAASFVLAFRSLKKQLMLNRMRAGMVSNITHELKTPVSTVKVALEALSRFDLKQDPALTEEYLGMASRELERLELLVNQVLNAAVYEQGNLVLNLEPVDLPQLIRHALEGCRPQLDRHQASVSLQIEDTFGNSPVEADPLHLQGVLINLIDNSLKHGGERPAITLDLSRSSREIILRYSNNGPPIPEEFLSRIFERFFRVPNGDRHDSKGFGLGLSYAAMVVQLHAGSIRAENNPEGGVSFIIRIPVKPS